MKRRLFYCAIVSACILITSCARRELTYDYRPWCDVLIDVDWTDFGVTPTGMTLMCFPQDGSKPEIITTTETKSTIVSLKAGKYDIFVFNQSPDEFGTIGFRGMDRYETVEVFAREAESQWYQSEEERIAREPERLGVDRLESFEVTEQMVERSGEQHSRGATDATAAITLKPKCVVSTALVRVKVKGIHNVRSVRGSMSGMAEGHLAGHGKTNGEKVTHLLEEWKISHDKTDHTSGEVTINFNTFGLPDGHPGASADFADVNRLKISFLLVDNKTVKDFHFDVADRIEPQEGDEYTLIVEIGFPEVSGKPDDKPIEVEDVEPENGSEGGFDVTVDNWGDRIEIDIPV